jgi:tetratricopeptide (TPR) repeat protein
MFELLLQADRALAKGALDQAEQAYWQLIELDSSNAIAAAGLAQVALRRGDKRLARTFADRALKIDPDNAAARRVMDGLEGREAGQAGETGLHVEAAQSLEALGRRRRSAHGEEGASEAARAEAEAAAAEAEAAVEAVAEDYEPPAPGRAPSGGPPAGPATQSRTARGIDPFSQAETAATIEAIDEADEEAVGEEAVDEEAASLAGGSAAGEAELAAAERESAALAADTAPSRISGAAAAAGDAAGESGAIAHASGRFPARGRFPVKSPTSEDLDDELPDAVDSDEETSGRPIPIEAGAFGHDHTSEEDAEAAAMREAMELMARGEADKESPDPQRKGLFRRFRGG